MIEREREVGPQPGPASRIDCGDSGQSFVRAAGEALYMRNNPRHEPSQAAGRYIGSTTLDLAREALEHVGERTRGMSPGDVFSRAMVTSDFPALLGDAIGRTLRKAYADAPSGLRTVARETTARDFRAKHRLQLSSAPQLELVNEHGEFKHGGLSEVDETYRLASYGKILAITRQAIVNDDLGGFGDMAARMGRAAVATENQRLADLVASNPVMSDGKVIFHVDHNNIAAGPENVEGASLSAARIALRSQKGLAGEYISVAPKFIVVGPTRETEAEKELAIIDPTATDEANVFAGKLKLLVDPRIGAGGMFALTRPRSTGSNSPTWKAHPDHVSKRGPASISMPSRSKSRWISERASSIGEAGTNSLRRRRNVDCWLWLPGGTHYRQARPRNEAPDRAETHTNLPIAGL